MAGRMPEWKPRRVMRVGAIVGAAFGAWNLVATRIDPLADDTPVALLLFYGPMFTTWGLVGFAAAKRTGRLVDGITVGALVAFATFVVFAAANLVRVNLFLDAIRHRADWQNMDNRFNDSGFASLRAFVNYNYAKGTPLKIVVASMVGASVGLVGGLSAVVGRQLVRRWCP